jgi:hypothetical protein
MVLSEDDIEQYVSGKCMFLAAALHRVYGWTIQATLIHEVSPPYIGHAWCTEPTTGHCVDIDGMYPPEISGWIYPEAELVSGLNEEQLREITIAGAYIPFTVDDWNKGVEHALPIVQGYLAPKLPSAQAV